METMKKTARILDRVFLILFWLLAVFCVVFAGMSVWLLLGGGASGVQILTYGGISLREIPAEEFAGVFARMTAMFVLAAGLLLYGIRVLRRILTPMKQGQPFHASVSRSFRRLGWLSLLLGVLQPVFVSMAHGMMARLVAQQTELNVGTPYNVLDVTFLLVAALLFLFSFVFQYGEELQRLSDETL